MMATLFQGTTVVEDTFWAVEGDQPIAEGEDIIVPLAYYQSHRDALRGRNHGKLGLRLEAGDNLESIAEEIDAFDLIGLDFPSFADGRSFSKARLLKDRLTFKGELRALGDIRIDQVGHMRRCGFDTMLVTHQPTIDALMYVKDPALSVHYQPAMAADEERAGPRPWTRRTA